MRWIRGHDKSCSRVNLVSFGEAAFTLHARLEEDEQL